MDKYEFNIKVEQLKKLVNKGDYETAMKIADTIDWRRVRNANLLSLVSSVYEKNHEYHEAKEILLIAFERAPIGKRLLYKLTQLALKEGEIPEAEAYYREFCSMAEDDSRQYILRYLILKAKHASTEQLIHALENYTSLELDEKWLYQLAELYSEAGRKAECVQICDKIMLMFGLGQYVDKAMELKLQYAPLSRYQRDLVENRDKYEEKLKAVEEGRYVAEEIPAREEENRREYDSGYGQEEPSYEDEGAGYGQEGFAYAGEEPGYDQEEPAYGQEEPSYEDEGEGYRQDDQWEDPAYTQTAAAREPEGYGYRQAAPVYRNDVPVTSAGRIRPEEDLRVQMKEAEVEEHLAHEMSRLSMDSQNGEEIDERPADKTRVIRNIRDLQTAREAYRKEEREQPERSRVDRMTHRNHLIIEAETAEEGLENAVASLKQIHRELGTKNPVVKIAGKKLNSKGLLNLADRLSGKDLIIDGAADMSDRLLDELNQLMSYDETGIIVVLIDSPERMEILYKHHPALMSHFECVNGSSDQEKDRQTAEDNRPIRMVKPKRDMDSEPEGEWMDQEDAEEIRAAEETVPERDEPEPENDSYGEEAGPDEEEDYADAAGEEEEYENGEEDSEPEEEMTIDEFAQYATEYASQIDCSITGKSMLALYERIEIMEEENIPLTRSNAEALIEEAADKAEKPSLGKMIKGVFSSKYDKDGLLILKEEHFI